MNKLKGEKDKNMKSRISLKNLEKTSRGITLIALVITIIVLLILAAVSIATLTGQNGILTRASDAKEQTEIGEVKERVQTDILGEQAGNNGELTKDKFIEILNKYFNDVPTEENFPEDLTSLILETKEEYGNHDIKISDIYNGSFPKTIDSLKVGEKVYYDTGNTSIGDQGIIECTVLYDKAYNEAKGTNYGIQIISSDVIKNSEGRVVTVPLGYNDNTVDESDNFEKAKNSYNNVLKRLYEEAQKYLNPTYASGARCVGSDPADPDWDTTTNEAGYYTKEIAEEQKEYQDYMETGGWYNDVFKNKDEKYKTDWTQMGTITGIKLASDNYDYCLASRRVDSGSDRSKFYVRSVVPSGYLSNFSPLYTVKSNGTTGASGVLLGFRPIFTLNSGIKITEGDGVDTPYTLAP